MTTSTHEITRLLTEWRGGDAEALNRLMPLVYDALRASAARQLGRESAGHTLQPTALVHESFLRLLEADVPWEDRAHFFAVAARTMRRVLVDHARTLRREKRGGGAIRVALEDVQLSVTDEGVEMLALDEALERLAARDERKARIIELHYFAGLTYEQAAAALGISPATVHRELRFAKAWMRRELGPPDGG